jgi:hypothetical protein
MNIVTICMHIYSTACACRLAYSMCQCTFLRTLIPNRVLERGWSRGWGWGWSRGWSMVGDRDWSRGWSRVGAGVEAGVGAWLKQGWEHG